MKRRLLFGFLTIIIACMGIAFTPPTPSKAADVNPPPGPDRYAVVTVDYTAYKWYMRAWSGRTKLSCTIVIKHGGEPQPWETVRDCGELIPNKWLTKIPCSPPQGKNTTCWKGLKAIACVLTVDHEGVPLPEEVDRNCVLSVYNDWISQPPCTAEDKRTCTGYYLHLVKESQEKKQVGKQLDPATAWISLEDCQPVLSASTNVCESQPTLVITGEEPLPNESITRIEGTYNGEPFSCKDTSICKFHIPETNDTGAEVKFWSYSSYGDSSFVQTAQVRVRQADEGNPDQKYWYVDVLSTQWKGQVNPTCAQLWGVFPPVGGVPKWLTTPEDSANLSSNIPYTYLAANLIRQGIVDASGCADGGIAPGGTANQCGLERARPAVNDWQNQFDDLIIKVAHDTDVPAHLLKNLFARESQFWPGLFNIEDAGLGQLTENGADTTLFWNKAFYDQFCPSILPSSICKKGYKLLSETHQIQLRRALVDSVDATCKDCPLGMDVPRAEYSVGVFANTMIANCAQAAQVIYNYTGELSKSDAVSTAASYEDLWKFTLVNYNAGGGCLAEGISNAYSRSLDLTWANVSPYLVGACAPSVDYVNDISK